MSILGLSEKRRLPRLGKIHLGIKQVSQKTGKEYPVEVEYFVVPERIAKIYGEKPKELPIMFPVENPDIFFAQFYKSYGISSLLKCKGDGQKAWTWDEKNGGLKEIPCPCEKLEQGDCKQIGILQVLLPDVDGVGVWQITTSSKNSIIDLNSSIDLIRNLCGRIRMIPLVLKREEMEIQRIEEGKPKKSHHYTLKLDLGVNLRQLQMAAQIPPEEILLPPPDENKDDLYYPAEGFAPKEQEPTAEKGEEAKKAEEVKVKKEEEARKKKAEEEKKAFDKAELQKIKQELEYCVDEYLKTGSELNEQFQKRLKELSKKEEFQKAIEFFTARLDRIKKDAEEERKLLEGGASGK